MREGGGEVFCHFVVCKHELRLFDRESERQAGATREGDDWREECHCGIWHTMPFTEGGRERLK